MGRPVIRVTTTSAVRAVLTPEERAAFELLPVRPDARLHLMHHRHCYAGALLVEERDASGYWWSVTARAATLAGVLTVLIAKLEARAAA